MAPRSNEQTSSAGKKTRKLEASSSTPQLAHVLHQSTRHNLQTSIRGQGVTSLTGKGASKKTDLKYTQNLVADIDLKQPAVCFSAHKEESLCLCPARKAVVEFQNSTKSSEVDELKRRLQNANLQIAEVVAQSAILVRDVQCAASKKIEVTSRYAPGREVTRSSTLSFNTQVERDFNHAGVGSLEQELAATRQELAACKTMLSAMRRKLEQTSCEKEKLETYLRSSVETSLKLQNTLVNQKAVMQLELLAAEERCRNESAGSIQSARNEAKHLQGQLDAALLSKAESDCLLRDCIQLLGHVQRDLFLVKVPNEWNCCFQSAVQEKYQRLQRAQEQVQMQRDSLSEASFQNTIAWTVLECVWKGAVQSLLESESSLDPKHNKHFETPDSLLRRLKKQDVLVRKLFWSSEDDLTPIRRTFMATPRSTNMGDGGQRGLRFEVLHPEEVLRQSLIKSEQEVEFLGDKVDELRIILEKVTLLLDCISKSSVTGHETRNLMRRIIEQLQRFEMCQKKLPV